MRTLITGRVDGHWMFHDKDQYILLTLRVNPSKILNACDIVDPVYATHVASTAHVLAIETYDPKTGRTTAQSSYHINNMFDDIEYVVGEDVQINHHYTPHWDVSYFTTRGEAIRQGLNDGDAPDGERRYYYGDGTLLQCETIVNGKKQGKVVRYHPHLESDTESRVEAVQYAVDGVAQGAYKEYYRNGQLRVEYDKINDIGEGSYVEYHENGAVMKRFTLSKGKPVGTGHTYHDNGVISTISEFDDNGRTLTRVIQDSKGRIHSFEGFKRYACRRIHSI